MIKIDVYITADGKSPFQKWFATIDVQARTKIRIAIERLADGNTSNLKSVGGGVHEIKLNLGAGLRVYLGREGDQLVILLHGGTKKRQSDDIAKAQQLWRDYQAEKRR